MKTFEIIEDPESHPRAEQQLYWTTVLELGLTLTLTKERSGSETAAVHQGSGFISMP
jgi:hypothetical protein